MTVISLLFAASALAYSFDRPNDVLLTGDAHIEDGVVVFDGAGQATLPNSADFNITPSGLTMSIVARTRPLDGKSRAGLDLFSKGKEWFFARDANGRMHISYTHEGKWPGWQAAPRGGEQPLDGEWCHYTASWSRIQRQGQGEVGYLMRLFQNGELVGSKELLHFEPTPGTNDVQFGWGLAHTAWALCGEVASVKLWKRALTEDEIEQDAIACGRVKVAGLERYAIEPGLRTAIEALAGTERAWMQTALVRAAEGGASQELLRRGIESNGKPFLCDPIWKVFESPRMKALVLLRGANRVFPLIGAYDVVAKRELFGRRTLTWRVDAQYHGKPMRWFDHDLDCQRAVHLTEDGFVATWQQMAVTVKVDCRLANGRIETKLDIDNGNPEVLLNNVVYPSFSLSRISGKDRLLIPFMGGIEHFNPTERNSTVADHSYVYPSSNMNLQMGAYYNEVGGVYYAAEDPTACLKQITAMGKRGNVDVAYSISVGHKDGEKGGNQYDQPGFGAIEPFSGDWYNAGQIYKRFLAASAPWWVKDLPRTETPKWFRDHCAWFELRIDANHGQTEEKMRIRTLRMRKFFDLPIGVHTRYYVDHAKCGYWPHFTPDADRMAYLNELRSHDIRVTGYIDDRLWCTTDSGTMTNDFMYGQLGSHYRIIKETGETPYERYTSWRYEKGGRGWYSIPYACAVMCPAARGWQEWLIWQCEDIARKAKLDGLYHDQIMAAIPFACFNPDHGHAFNDAQTWVADGYTPYLREMRRRTARINPDTVHGSEDGAEAFCEGQLDFCLNWRWTHEMVPLYVSIYAGRFQYYGRVLGDTCDKASDRGGFFAKIAEELVWGEHIGEFNNEVDDREATLYGKRAAHMRLALVDYLNASEFLHPPRFRRPMPTVSYKWNAYRGGSGGGDRPIKTDVVRATCWERGSDRARMAVFANSETTPIECEPILPGFDSALILVDDQPPRRVKDGAFKLALDKRGFAIVIAGDEALLAAEEKRLAPIMKRIAAFTPEPLDSECEFAKSGSPESIPPKLMGKLVLTTRKGGERCQTLCAREPFRVKGTKDLSLHDGGSISARVFFDRPSRVSGQPDVFDGICMKDNEFLLGRSQDGLYFNLHLNGKWAVKATAPKLPVGKWVEVEVTVEKADQYVIRYYLDGMEVYVTRIPLGSRIPPEERKDLNVGTCWGNTWAFKGKLSALTIAEQ